MNEQDNQSTRRLKPQRGYFVSATFSGIILLVSLFCICGMPFGFLLTEQENEQFLTEGLQLDGRIADRRLVEDNVDYNHEYYLTYEYIVEQADEDLTFRKEIRIDEEQYEQAELGAPISITYLPDELDNSRLTSEVVASTPVDFVSDIVLLVGLVGLGVVGFMAGIGNIMEAQRFYRKSRTTTAHVVDRWIVTPDDDDDDDEYVLAYRFTADLSDGSRRTVTKAELLTNPGYKTTYQQAEIGAALSVRYLPSDPQNKSRLEL